MKMTTMDKPQGTRAPVYLAAPLFSDAERNFNTLVRDFLVANGYPVYLPQETGEGIEGPERDRAIFESHLAALDQAPCVVAVCDGPDADSGTAWEIGYACAREIPVIALATDRRRPWAGKMVNLMVRESARMVSTVEEILPVLKSLVP